ncbi:MarR family winged helix-turn-helix transcriptional regulator [uncultured Roseobacter sp.]|uniref:MarR family winged helix-turn-helix transcriptional regulator n=1 Tax=uncultured Roseobacter sp. TaxID=114847 RepID=UPI002623DF1D|nr:MarR family transcriptional regulator [uncultured Roseobacter sp.]
MANDLTPPTTADPMAPMLCFDLYAASQAFTRVYKPLLAPLGLTYPQYLVMLNLWPDSPLSVGEIGRRVSLESNTLTPLIKRLQEAGLVTRTRDPDDERRVVVALTDRGQALEAQAAHVPGCILEATGMPQAEIEALQRTLRGLTRTMLDAAASK